MPETTTDNKRINLRVATFAGILFFAISLTFTATGFYYKAESTAHDFELNKAAEKRRNKHLVEKQDLKIDIRFLELELKECRESK